jgi:glutathione synthase/RimK-type ligase-like ATP-grasp enzyme
LTIHHYILEKYIAGQEMRYLVLHGAVIGVHRSDYGISVQESRALERISYPPSAWDPVLAAMAIRVAQTLDLAFAAVDYLLDEAGNAYVLEVNSTPGLKWFHAPSSGPVIDVARLFLEAIVRESGSPLSRLYSV